MLNDKKEADRALREVRRLRQFIAHAEERVEKQIETIRDRLVRETNEARIKEQSAVDSLRNYFQARRNGQKFIRLQSGVIGVRVVPRVEVPKGAAENPALPDEAKSVRTRVNKTALAQLGENVMAKVGARIVRPQKFYVRPHDEDAAR